MMHGGNLLLLFTITFLHLNLHTIRGNDSNEEAYPNYAFMQIFKGVPAFFEYLLGALEQKPEMLEKNDVNMFAKTNEENLMKKRSTDQSIEDRREEAQKTNHDLESAKMIESSAKSNEDDNSILQKNKAENIFCKAEPKRDILHHDVKNNAIFEYKIKRRHFNKAIKDFYIPELKEYNNKAWNEAGFFGFAYQFALDVDPEDIQESILMTEKLLEEYNNNKRNK